jgi:hypothetical protein
MQTTVQNFMDIGLPGQLADLVDNMIISKANYSKQLDAVTITAANTATTCTINGTAFTDSATDKTKAEMAEAISILINAGSEPVTAVYVATNEYFTVESNTPGTAATVVGTANCSVANQIANAAAIGFGIVVVRDQTDDQKARLPQAAADITDAKIALGFTRMTQAAEQNYGSAGGVGYALESSMSIMRKGRIYVMTEDAVTDGGAVYVRHVAGAGETLGSVRSDADGSDASILPGAAFRKATSASGISIVELNLP